MYEVFVNLTFFFFTKYLSIQNTEVGSKEVQFRWVGFTTHVLVKPVLCDIPREQWNMTT
jgi:hypothetical protein